MKSSIRHGAVLRCDHVKIVETEDDFVHSEECDERFVSYSVASMVREQAKLAGWDRPKVGRVRWPGRPPAADAKKVDICPTHMALVMTEDEYTAHKAKAKAERKAERERERAEAKAEKKRQKAAARDVAKAVKAQKAAKKRKKKEGADAT